MSHPPSRASNFIAIIDYDDSIANKPESGMASITIRNLDDDTKHRLRVRAAMHGRSMEEEAREILRRVMNESAPPRDLAAAIRSRLTPAARADVQLPAREPMREPPAFDQRSEP